MARTRGSKATAAKPESKSTTTPDNNSKYTLPAESTNAPRIFILPRRATKDKDSKIVSLLHAKCGRPMRYLVCPEGAIYEFTRIAAPKATPRSWMIECDGTGEFEKKTSQDRAELWSYVSKGADLFVATPVDPIFIVLPAFADQSASTKDGKRMFVTMDDHFDSIRESSPHLSEILRWGKIRQLFESRMAAICDTAEAGDETMFRFNDDKLLVEVLRKARAVSEEGLPQSLEEKFVIKPLEAPVVGVKREATTSVTQQQTQTEAQTQAETSVPASEASTPKVESADSQSSVTTTATSASETSTAATSVTEEFTTTVTNTTTTEFLPTLHASEEVVKLQRLQIAFRYICASYLTPAQASALALKLNDKTQPQPLVDFAPLAEYLQKLDALRQEAAATRSMDNYSRKRVLDEEEVAERAEKKRKKDEDEKRKKAGESRAVRDLKKVNTGGMKKMSDFFRKK
ncbi:ribonuclease H2, subunit B [Hypoxylon fuscum]|nr:ribonuclease H2, subunit B [Hypoxylon fuscum]